MATNRMRRVNEAVREVVSTAVSEELSDPRLGFLTVTGAEVSPDLRSARIYVSVLGDEHARTQTLTALAASHGVLQSAIGTQLRMKRTPTLTFAYDDTVERASRIGELLDDE